MVFLRLPSEKESELKAACLDSNLILLLPRTYVAFIELCRIDTFGRRLYIQRAWCIYCLCRRAACGIVAVQLYCSTMFAAAYVFAADAMYRGAAGHPPPPPINSLMPLAWNSSIASITGNK